MPPKPEKKKATNKSAEVPVEKPVEKTAKSKAAMAYPVFSAADADGIYVVVDHAGKMLAGPYNKKTTAKTWRNAVNKYQEANAQPICRVARAATHPLGASY